MTIREESDFSPATQPWLHTLPIMQQSVLLAAIRGPDGIRKTHVSKLLLRWYRRCILLSAFDRRILSRPFDFIITKGGSFTGPSIGPVQGGNVSSYLGFSETEKIQAINVDPTSSRQYDVDVATRWENNWTVYMQILVNIYLMHTDEIPHHFQLHFLHASEILGYKHPDEVISGFWLNTYLRLTNDMHLSAENEEEMDWRLSDNRDEWRKREEVSTS